MNNGEHGKNYNNLLWKESFLAIYVIMNTCNKPTYALISMCTMFFFFLGVIIQFLVLFVHAFNQGLINSLSYL
jgi:hypothetical protein